MALSSAATVLIIIGIFLSVAFTTFVVTFLMCLFCPFCIIPKLKKRRPGQQVDTRTSSDVNQYGNDIICQPQVTNHIPSSGSSQVPASQPKQKNEQRQQKLNNLTKEPANSTSIPMTTLNVLNKDPPPKYSAVELCSTNPPYNPHFSDDNSNPSTSKNPTAPPVTPTSSKKLYS